MTMTIAKSDLFLVPLFNLVLLTFDAIPIIREKRDKAIESLRTCAHHVDTGECILIAPEGTRSLNGELQSFKKGPFHLYQYFEETNDTTTTSSTTTPLRTLMIPLMIYGAFDLLPPGSRMPTPGKVVAKFLRPISRNRLTKLCDVGNSNSNRDIKELERDVLSNVLRKQMLEATAKVPSITATKLGTINTTINTTIIIIIIIITITRFEGDDHIVPSDSTSVLHQL